MGNYYSNKTSSTEIMEKKKIIFLIIMVLLAAGVFVAAYTVRMNDNRDISKLMQKTSALKGQAYQNMPIYSDYINHQRERKLRTHLLKDHLKAAEALNLEAAGNRESIETQIREKQLERITRDKNSLFYFYNLPRGNRYLRDFAARGLNNLGKEFQNTLASHGFKAKVKFAVTSAFRGGNYQKSLRKRNRNAVAASSHAYGISFDVFFDEYFVVVDKPDESFITDSSRLNALRGQYGYLLGGALRRQFKAAMAETLIRLQNAGSLYVILEKRQRCFHVTILK